MMVQGIQVSSESYTSINTGATDNIKRTSAVDDTENTESTEKVVESKVPNTDKIEISSEGKLANKLASELTESSESTELSNLSEAQLKDLVASGTITQAEMNTELARRKSLDAMETNDATEIDSNMYLEQPLNINLLDGTN